MSRLNVRNLFNENEDGGPVVSGISTFSSQTILFHHQDQRQRDLKILVRE